MQCSVRSQVLGFLFVVWLWPVASLWSFSEIEGDNGYLVMRGAVDLSGMYARYQGPDLLFPDKTHGQGGTSLRWLAEAMAGEHLRFDLNVYQNFRTQSSRSAMFSSGAPRDYRTTYIEYDWGSRDVSAPLAVDRLSIMAYLGPVDLTLGRQPIGLGTNFIFTPNDVFHPFAAGEMDTAFRPGVDAVRLDGRLGQLSKITVLSAIGYDSDNRPDWKESAALARASTNWQEFDWSLLGGKCQKRYLAGAAISGELWKLGLRMEGNVSFPETDEDIYVQVAGGFDHRWENTLHLMVEYYYHGNGETKNSRYLQHIQTMDTSSDPYIGQHYLGILLSGEALPVLTLQAAILANLTDPSAYVSPALTYNAADEVDLIVTGAIPLGRRAELKKMYLGYPILGQQSIPELGSEYGSYPASVSFLTRVYF